MAGATLSPFLILMPYLGQLEPAWIDASLRSGFAARGLWEQCRVTHAHAHTQPARARHGADRKFDPGAPAGGAATGQLRLRRSGRRRPHPEDRDLTLPIGHLG